MDQCRHTLEQHNWNIEVPLQIGSVAVSKYLD